MNPTTPISVVITEMPDNTVIPRTQDNVRRHKSRCSHKDCRRKLKLTDLACKCKLRFCRKHIHAEHHGCSFDYRGLSKTEHFAKMAGLGGGIYNKILKI